MLNCPVKGHLAIRSAQCLCHRAKSGKCSRCGNPWILDRMTHEEVAGVMAHELAHVKNRDTLIMTITATIAGAISMLANFALFFGNNRNNPMGLVGTLAMMFWHRWPPCWCKWQSAGPVNMKRTGSVPRSVVALCGLPRLLTSWRKALRQSNHAAERNPATAHMFIINPLHANAVDSLFSTHPNTRNRIAALERIAGLTNTGRGPWG